MHVIDTRENGTRNACGLSRRAFVGGAGVLAAVVAGGLAGCGVDPTLGTLGVSPDGETGAGQQGGGSYGEGGVMRIGMEAAYPPSNWQESEATETNIPIENVNGAYAQGYDVQIARRICDEMGYEPVAVKMAFSGLIEALNQGQIDMIIAGMADTPERRASIEFSESYHDTVYALMVRQDSPFAGATSLDDFEGASVLGQKSTELDKAIDQIPGVNHLSAVDSVPLMLSQVSQGSCDAIIVNLEATPGYLESSPDLAVIEFPEGEGFTLEFSGSCVGIKKGNTELVELVDKALETVSDEERAELWDWAVENQPS